MLPSLAISKTQAGVIYASFFIAYTVFSPLLGLIGDRCDVRLVIAGFVVTFAAGTFLMAYASSIIQASLFFALAGIGPILSPIIAGWVADTTGTLAWSFVLAAGGAVISLFLLVPVCRTSPVSLPGNR